jgi:hypothetical protein
MLSSSSSILPSFNTACHVTSTSTTTTSELLGDAAELVEFTTEGLGSLSDESALMDRWNAITDVDYEIVKVDLDDGRDYPIYIGTGFSDEQASQLLQSHIQGNKVLIVTNDRIAPMYLEKYRALLLVQTTMNHPNNKKQLQLQVETLVLPDGEEYKNMEMIQLILDKALELGLDRKATFVALGGGVIGDMVGFAAAIYQRGVNFIQVRYFVVFAPYVLLTHMHAYMYSSHQCHTHA